MRRSIHHLLLLLLLAAGCAEPGPLPGPLPAGITLDGTWESNWGDMALRHEGRRVVGTFAYRDGRFEGDLDGDLLLFDWSQPANRAESVLAASGKGWLRVSPDGQTLEGAWGYREDREGGGAWRATRPRDGQR